MTKLLMDFDIFRPWLTLDPWQKKYIYDKDPRSWNFLHAGRQSGKTTAMSLRAVELCLHHFKKGEMVLVNSITEKQAQHVLNKSLIYAKEKYFNKIVMKGKDKPTKHKIIFKNGTGILCYAAGDTGEGQRGFTIKKLMIDEGSRMSEEYFIAAMPMLSVIKGSTDIGSTPFGKTHKDGTPKFFYKCSLDDKYNKYYISAEDCPRHTKEFLDYQKSVMSKLAYAQEYLAEFTDALKRIFSPEWIKKVCTLKRGDSYGGKNYLGVDVAGWGKDLIVYAGVEKLNSGIINQRLNIIEQHNLTTETTKRIKILDTSFSYVSLNVDDGGLGFGVFSELLSDSQTKHRTVALNNASRDVDSKGEKSRKLLGEEMFTLMLALGEQGKLFLLDDDEIKDSLGSIQHDEGKIFGANSHAAEAIKRAVWGAAADKRLNIYIY